MTPPKPLGSDALTCLTDPLSTSGLRTLFRQRRAGGWKGQGIKGSRVQGYDRARRKPRL